MGISGLPPQSEAYAMVDETSNPAVEAVKHLVYNNMSHHSQRPKAKRKQSQFRVEVNTNSEVMRRTFHGGHVFILQMTLQMKTINVSKCVVQTFDTWLLPNELVMLVKCQFLSNTI